MSGYVSFADSTGRWLAVRLEFLGSLIILSAAGFAIISVSTGSALSAGFVGLAMSYALQITQSLNWIVRQTVEVETNIVSVERVLEYARLPSEAPEVIHRNRPPISMCSLLAKIFPFDFWAPTSRILPRIGMVADS
jgi:ATP-binding cassette, subfamily C (CFTR/MRP), member 1